MEKSRTIFKLKNGLKKILENRVVEIEPKTGSYSWVVFAKSNESKNIFKASHTIRLEYFLRQIANDPKFINDSTIVIKVWDGADYVTKMLRRIFKGQAITSEYEGKNWYNLSESDIEWLNKIKICKSFGVQSEVVELLSANTASKLKAEGLAW